MLNFSQIFLKLQDLRVVCQLDARLTHLAYPATHFPLAFQVKKKKAIQIKKKN